MAITKSIFRYHVGSMAALDNRITLQQKPINRWLFQFPKPDAKVYTYDNIEVRNGVKLHAGLKIIVVVEGTYSDDSEDIATSLTNSILNLFSFATNAQCEVPRLISHISIRDDTSDGTFFQQPDPDNTILNGTPRKIDENIFNALWVAFDGNQDKESLSLALSWFRKAIGEKTIIDEFVSFWIALEVANFTVKNIFKRKTGKKLPKWDPVTEIFASKIKSIGFKTVKRARNDILHGNRPLSPEFTARIRKYIIPLRNAIVYLVGSILVLDDAIISAIISNTMRKLLIGSAVELRGFFENLPTDMDELLKDYPEMITKGKPNQYSISDTGELDVTINRNQTAKLPAKTIFHAHEVALKVRI